jgi:hypothetical protein
MATALDPKVKKHLRRNLDWPPKIFNCSLEELLQKKLGNDYSVNGIASLIEITPLTMRRILAGGGVTLENAMRLSVLAGKKIEEIWVLR